MNQIIPARVSLSPALPAPVVASGPPASRRLVDFFTSNIHNRNTRAAYRRAVMDFLAWREMQGVTSLAAVEPLHVATWIETQGRETSAPTVKQKLAALHLFDWLVLGQIVTVNPAGSVGGSKNSVLRSHNSILLEPAEVHKLLDHIDVTTLGGLRDRALIGLMVYSFAGISAALGMKVEDVYNEQLRLWVRLKEKGGKRHKVPCHHNLEAYLTAYIDSAGISNDPKGPLFRTIGRKTKQLTRTPLLRVNAYDMLQRRAADAGIATKIGNHSFRATGITAFLKYGGILDNRRAWPVTPVPTPPTSTTAAPPSSRP